MTPLELQILVLAKAPLPGRVKTRLAPPFTHEQAAALATAALADTIDAVLASSVRRRVLVLDGEPGPWRPAGIELLPQRGCGLDERIAHALDDAWSDAQIPLLLVGMDTPQMTSDLLCRASARLVAGDVDAVLGLADDGGFWTLGLSRPLPDLVIGVPMSTDHTGAAMLTRLTQAGLRVGLLPQLRDVDRASDAAAVASVATAGRFGTLYSTLVSADSGAA